MTKIVGIENMVTEQLNHELQNGGKFVVFEYCVSIVIMTFKRPTHVYFVKNGESTAGKSIGYTLTSLLLGWWGIPWGPIHTIGALATNLKGGNDVTADVIAALNRQATEAAPPEGGAA